MKIQFERLGPTETVTYDGRIYKNGAVVEMEESHARAYLNAKLAVMVEDVQKALARVKLEEKNTKIRKKAVEDESKKKELDNALNELVKTAETGGKV